jgi:outer membrane protein assembly factor BamA
MDVEKRNGDSFMSSAKTIALLSLVGLLVADPVSGQQELEPETRRGILRQKREEKAQALVPHKVSSGESRLRPWEKAKFPTNWLIKGWHGFRPVIGGMPSGSGTVLGGGYVYGLENQYSQFQVNGRYSTKGFTQFDGEFVIPPPQVGRRIEGKFSGAYQDYTSLYFYGLGNDSSVDNKANYSYKARWGRGDFWLNPRGLLSLGLSGGYLSARADSGESSSLPSIEETFDPDQIPGATDQRTDYIITGGWVEFDIRDKWEDPPLGVVARVFGQRFEDTTTDRFDFTRVVADVKGYVPLFARSRTLALRFYTSHSVGDDGGEVPIYLMETLGGAKTIRGYDEYRFRDAHNLYVSAEYRYEVWAYIDFTVFFDAGKVFDDIDDFDFNDMHTGYGVGFRIHAPGGMALRLDFANSTEGFKIHFSGGPTF